MRDQTGHLCGGPTHTLSPWTPSQELRGMGQHCQPDHRSPLRQVLLIGSGPGAGLHYQPNDLPALRSINLTGPRVGFDFEQNESVNQSTSVSQLIGRMRLDQSSQWLDEGQDESRIMGPLVGELDESASQWSGSSGADGSNFLGWVDLRGSGQTGVSSDREGAPEAHSLSSSFLPGLEPLPHYQCLQRSGTSSQEVDRTGASDSFHPLLAEVTHNETAEPSMTFHLPEEEVEGPCFHEEESDHEAPAGDLNLCMLRGVCGQHLVCHL
ncbi:uncharacterized protein [Salvelinus sp. IW2-2015]|uniref:uncharacterized protein n=1 Tax=Salvelinus sp. IW2-2015 TaxID=2691554 RepID=UPI0038D4B923